MRDAIRLTCLEYIQGVLTPVGDVIVLGKHIIFVRPFEGYAKLGLVGDQYVRVKETAEEVLAMLGVAVISKIQEPIE